jgi:hypothetical protein
MLRPPPQDLAAVLNGSVVAAVADPLFVKRFVLLGRQERGIVKHAFLDVTKGTVLLIEDRARGSGSFEKERQETDTRKDPDFQTATRPMVRMRSPS